MSLLSNRNSNNTRSVTKAIVNSKVIKNYIIPQIVKQLEILYREKEHLYPLIIILEELVLYKDGIINSKIKPI